MADRTSQPADGVGVNPLYSGAVFLWNGAAPTKNQINAAAATLRGATVSGGADGQYQHFNDTTGPMSWSITRPASAYTLVAVSVHPTASVGQQFLVSIPGGNFRLESQTTGGGVYHVLTHTSAAAASNSYAEGVSAFDSEMWVYVACFNGTTLRQYLKRGDGANAASYSQTIAYSNTGGDQINLGASAAGQGLYAVLLVPSDVGDTEALALRDNPWRMFAPEGGADTTAPVLTSPTSASVTHNAATVGASTDEANGTAYVVAVTTGSAAPSAAQIIAGQDGAGASVAAGLKRTLAISATGAFTFAALSGLAATQGYTYYIVHADSASPPNNSNVLSGTFTTSAAPAVPAAPGAMLPPTLGAVPVSFEFGTSATATSYKWRSRVDAGAFGSYSSPISTPTGTVNVTIGTTVTIEMLATNATGDSATATTGSITLSTSGVVSTGGGAFLAAILLG